MPTRISDLPPELLPDLLRPLVRRRDLYNVCLVNREWRTIGQPLLYRWIRLFGKDLAITAELFRVLASNPRLARMVRKLEVRVYPLSNVVRERRAMEELAIRVLTNCENVEELVWTRKGSLTDDVFAAIVRLPRLKSFELNAHTNLSPGSWSATHLCDLPQLESLSLILPDRNVANILPQFLKRQQSLSARASSDEPGSLALRELSILCRESTVVNDRVVSAIVPFLSNGHLISLGLAGCSRLTGEPLLSLLPQLPHLQHLALEACDLDSTFYARAGPSLAQLKSFKVTHPDPRSNSTAFYAGLERLLEHTHELTAFTLYYSGVAGRGRRDWPIVPAEFVASLTISVGTHLKKFEMSNVLMSVESFERLTLGARRIKDLVIHLGENFDFAHLTACFAPLSELRTLHVLSQRSDILQDQVLELAEQCPNTLRQIGYRNRVWILRRTWTESDQQMRVRFFETASAFGAFRRNKYGAEEDFDFEAEIDEEGVDSSSGDTSEEDI